MKKIKFGFEPEIITIPIDDILFTKVITPLIKRSPKYAQIVSSFKASGEFVEHPVVARSGKSKYILLDGHLRINVLKELGYAHVDCIISTDDEGYTYNKYINRLSPIQEHNMIRKAIENGVSEKKIAEALNVDVKRIKDKKGLLKDICPEAAEMLKDKIMSFKVFNVLRKVKTVRQIEMAQLMVCSNKYSHSYALDLLKTTLPEHLIVKPKVASSLPTHVLEKKMRLENELQTVSKDIGVINDHYWDDILTLTEARSYLERLLENKKVSAYLKKHHGHIFGKFQEIMELDFFKQKQPSGI